MIRGPASNASGCAILCLTPGADFERVDTAPVPASGRRERRRSSFSDFGCDGVDRLGVCDVAIFGNPSSVVRFAVGSEAACRPTPSDDRRNNDSN